MLISYITDFNNLSGLLLYSSIINQLTYNDVSPMTSTTTESVFCTLFNFPSRMIRGNFVPYSYLQADKSVFRPLYYHYVSEYNSDSPRTHVALITDTPCPWYGDASEEIRNDGEAQIPSPYQIYQKSAFERLIKKSTAKFIMVMYQQLSFWQSHLLTNFHFFKNKQLFVYQHFNYLNSTYGYTRKW